MTPAKLRLNFVGDVMLGRLIDQCFPTHVNAPDEARIAESFKVQHSELRSYNTSSPWGDTLPLFREADLNIINLETSVTVSNQKWPNKVFNYRMHPDNIKALHPARVTYASLANNHIMDYCVEGCKDTVAALENAGVPFAGVGSLRKNARDPAILTVPATTDAPTEKFVYVWSASDHPWDWHHLQEFHSIDYSEKSRAFLKQNIQDSLKRYPEHPAALKIFSVHWGPNFSWRPAEEIKNLAHYLIDECGIDIVHGHSSHHVQGVEQYHGKLIIYGCGDFVDDYALVADFRNDLSAVWRVNLRHAEHALELDTIEVFPTKITHFQVNQLPSDHSDHEWVRTKISQLSSEMGFQFSEDGGDQGQLTGVL